MESLSKVDKLYNQSFFIKYCDKFTTLVNIVILYFRCAEMLRS